MPRFHHFLAIDWSGAAGERHDGIALALANADGGPPRLMRRGRRWSRADVLGVLRDELPPNTLVGMDLGIALPFIDCGAYFPGLVDTPTNAPALWAMVDQMCDDDLHLAANNFVDHPGIAAFFRRHGGREGVHFRCDGATHGRGRFRVTEMAQAAMGCRPYSNFNLVGASQVGKSSLTGMRLLRRLRGHLPVWPIDLLPATGSVLVEIYTSLAALEAGRSAAATKMRSTEELNAALKILGSPPVPECGPLDDHSADALLTAAWLRTVADQPHRWAPAALNDEIAQTEGWTFGAL